MEDLHQKIQALDETEFTAFLGWLVSTEKPRRAAAPLVTQAVAEEKQRDSTALWQAHPELKPQVKSVSTPEKPVARTVDAVATKLGIKPFVQPTGAHDAYPKDSKFTYKDRIWETLIDGYCWAPDAPGMDDRYRRDVTELFVGGTDPAQAEPATGGETITQWRAGLSVTAGQKIAHNGVNYAVVQPHTTQAGWEPPQVPALFKKI